MRNKATLTAGVGEVEPQSENAYRVSPAEKMVNAWNTMTKKSRNMIYKIDKMLYPSFSPEKCSGIFEFTNIFGI
jgi:hypothetical protein